MEEVFETLKTADADMKTVRSSNIIEPNFNRNFGNSFHHQNNPNHQKHVYIKRSIVPIQILHNTK